MVNWNEINDEIKAGTAAGTATHDIIRRKYLKQLHKVTKRNVIIYYSGWLQKPDGPGIGVSDYDKNGFMTVINKLDRKKGLDLLLHTPGGDTAATESLVEYLKSMFGNDIRAIIPQLALSAGTMIACACKEILMGEHSSLGPIDPQMGGLPAHGIKEEFYRAAEEIKKDNSLIYTWQPIIAKYNPTLIGECEKAITWSEEMVKEWLIQGMFNGTEKAEEKVEKIIKELGDHALTKSHNRHISLSKCKEIGLKVVPLEKDQVLQDAVLSVHHACMHTLSSTDAVKIIENHNGTAFVNISRQVVIN